MIGPMPFGFLIGGAVAIASRLRRPAATPPVVTIDPTLGHPAAAELLGALHRDDAPTVVRVLATSTDPVVRNHLVGMMSDNPGRPGWSDGLVERYPHEPAAWLASGASLIGRAWEVRGHGYASAVEADAWPAFFEMLREADTQLVRAGELDPADATPWTLALATARGLQLGPDESTRRFQEATARVPFHPGAVNNQLQNLCVKWGGSAEDMFAFTHWVLRSAPPGSAAHQVVPMAHFEHVAQLMRDDPDLTISGYFHRPDVLAELKEAAYRSVFHDSFGNDLVGILCQNVFAFAFTCAGELGPARRLYLAIGDRVTERPWMYVGEPAVVFTKLRAGARGYDVR